MPLFLMLYEEINMLQSFTVVGTQVFILFILIGIGFLGARKGIIQKEGVSTITEIMLYIVTPCVIIQEHLVSKIGLTAEKAGEISMLIASCADEETVEQIVSYALSQK